MPTSENAKIMIEGGQSLVDYEALTDSGDHTVLNPSTSIMSGKEGFTPDVRPNGIVTGLDIGQVAASGSNDVVDTRAFTAYSIGVSHSVSASTDQAITRPAGDVAKVLSITMTSAGAIAEVAGTDGATTTFSETRGAAGGPPLIPVDSVELFQVRLTTTAAAPITADEIYQNIGTHTERSGYPSYSVNNIGEGTNTTNPDKVNAFVEMADALPLIHTGPIAKKVYAQHYTPSFIEQKGYDFSPVENSHSVGSTQYYGGTVGSSSSTIGQGSFTALLQDGTTDYLVANKDKTLTVKVYQDENKTPYILTQGKVGLGRTFPVADQAQAAVTISAESISAEFNA